MTEPTPAGDITPRDMVDDILNLEEGLTEWEIDFTERVDERLRFNKPLNANQLHRLTEIHNERVIENTHSTPDEE